MELNYDAIDSYISAFSNGENYTSNGNQAKAEDILKEWKHAKEDGGLLELFGNELILKKRVEFSTPINDLRDSLCDLCCNDLYHFYELYSIWVDHHYALLSPEYSALAALIETDNLAYNHISIYQSHDVKMPSGKVITIQKEAKTIKTLAKVVKEINDPKISEAFEQFRLDHSRILNQKKLAGTLCLSIHPLDYMTMSDNNCDWDSCMSWMNEGSYRRGTVEMMNSPYVIVAYLESDNNPLRWDKYTWNNKKWRSLIIYHPDIIVSVKDYPYHNPEFLQMVVEWIAELSSRDYDTKAEIISPFVEAYYHGHKYKIEPDTQDMYNDFGACAHHYGMFHKDFFDTERNTNLNIYYSGRTQCMCCGSVDAYFPSDENILVCENCCDDERDRIYCECCDSVIYDNEDIWYWVDDERWCEYCFNTHAAKDDLTDEYHYKSDIVQIYLKTQEEGPLDTENSQYITAWSYAATNGYNSYPAAHYDIKSNVYFWLASELTQEQIDEFFDYKKC